MNRATGTRHPLAGHFPGSQSPSCACNSLEETAFLIVGARSCLPVRSCLAGRKGNCVNVIEQSDVTWNPKPFLRFGGILLAGGGIVAASACALLTPALALAPPFLKWGSLAWRIRFMSPGDRLAALLAAACNAHN